VPGKDPAYHPQIVQKNQQFAVNNTVLTAFSTSIWTWNIFCVPSGIN